ncbi:Phosphocarrier protein kinase/phosphorylase, nitrogen regulation associated [Olavius algarvensis associated proteobacterium Delta 3]|nr:Phosphocarrier protein kinase/phosphorylase, nitrogen regulation associated [Olavius algarvensis associated proteobacterium Delta 3]
MSRGFKRLILGCMNVVEEIGPPIYDQYIKALMEISRAITSDLFLEDLLKLIVMVTAKVTGVEICSLWLIDDNENPPKIRLKATQAFAPEYVKDRSLDLNEGVVGYVATHKKPLLIKNVLRNRKFKEKEMARKLGLVSMAGVPLKLKDDKVIGVLNCFTAKPHDFSDTEINLLTAVANQAAVAILNTELMVKTRVIQEELEIRKMVERAKEILMQRRRMKGDEAYRWIQKQSMDTRKPIRQVAEAILLSEELYHK